MTCAIFRRLKKEVLSVKEMTHDEFMDFAKEYFKMIDDGRRDEASEFIKSKVPLSPHIAKSMVDVGGKDILLRSGWDLSAAEAAYGKNWLDR